MKLKVLLASIIFTGIVGVSFGIAQAAEGVVEVNRFEAPGSQPCSLAFDGTNLYMGNCGGFRTIFVLGTDGTLVRSFLAPSNGGFDGLGNPRGLAFDGTHLFVADLSGTIFEIDTAGTQIFNTFSVPARARPSGMTFDGSHLFISDADSSQIFVYTTDGVLVSQFLAPDREGTPIRPAGLAFQAPHLFTIDIFSADIDEFTSEGTFVQAFPGPRDPGIQGLGGITFAGPNMFIAEVSDSDPFNPPEIAGTIFELGPISLLPTISLTIDEAGDQMSVTITTEPNSSSDPWCLVVVLTTPTPTGSNPFLLFRLDPVQEFITLEEGLSRSSFDELFARPCQVVTSESVVILDQTLPLTVPGGFPSGSYTWATAFFSQDLSRHSNIATASFTYQEEAESLLTVSKVGRGTVTSSPGGINCGADCSEPYSSGTVVTLTAIPARGSEFVGWGGDCAGAGTATTCNVTMNGNKSVNAIFELEDTGGF